MTKGLLDYVQLSLDDEAHARNTDPDTSHAAAATAKVNLNEERALRALVTLGGRGTIMQVVKLTGHYESISPRFRPLRGKGFIRNTGKKRRNDSGKMAILWEITPEGREALKARDDARKSGG